MMLAQPERHPVSELIVVASLSHPGGEGGGAEARRHRLQQIVVRVHPHDTGIATEPRPLSSCERPGPPHGFRDRGGERDSLLEVGEELAVAERLSSGSRETAGPPCEAPDLVEQPGI